MYDTKIYILGNITRYLTGDQLFTNVQTGMANINYDFDQEFPIFEVKNIHTISILKIKIFLYSRQKYSYQYHQYKYKQKFTLRIN